MSQKRKPRWAHRILRLQRKLGWDLAQLAGLLQVNKATIRNWVNGAKAPGKKSAARIENLEKGVRNLARSYRRSNREFPSTFDYARQISSAESPTRGSFNYLRYLEMINAASGPGEIELDDEPEGRWMMYMRRGASRRVAGRPGFSKAALAALEKARTLFADDIENFPVTKIQKRCGLSEGEVRILVSLVFADVGLFEGSGQASGQTLAQIGSEKGLSPMEGRKRLAPQSLLRKHGLIEKGFSRGGFPWDEEAPAGPMSVLRGSYRLSPGAREELLGDLLKMSVLEEAGGGTANALEPRFGLGDVILPTDHRSKLEVAVSEIANRSMIFEEWGLAERIHYGKGTILLFGGAPGTGKTMAAEGLAKELGKKIMSACFPKIVSKWVGETEKNIAALFAAARDNDAVLFIDEADGLFASREMATHSWEIRDVNVLLKEVEAFEGVVVLATNHAVALDKALESRLSLHLHFPMPDERAREAIWKQHLPEKLPLSDDVDLGELARTYAISGRDIKQAVLMAARTAAHRGGAHPMVTMKDLEEAARSRRPGEDGKIGFAG